MKKILLICIIVLVAVGAIGATAYLINSFKTDSGRSSESMVYINFDSNGGTKVPNQILSRGESVSEPTPPTREYYVFDGWYLDDTKYVFEGSSASEDLTLQAKWVPDYVSYNFLASGSIGPDTYVSTGNTQSISGIVRYSLTPGTFQYLNFDTIQVTLCYKRPDYRISGFYFYNSLNPSLKVRFTSDNQNYPQYIDSEGSWVDVSTSDRNDGSNFGYQIKVWISQTILNGQVCSTYYYSCSGRDDIDHYRIVGVGSSSDYKLLFEEMATVTFFDKNFDSIYFTTSQSPDSRYPHFRVSDSSKVDVNYNLVSVIFDPNNGGDPKKYTVVKNSAIGINYTPTKSNYDFVGWYYGNTAIALNDYVIKQDVTLTARWTPKPVYTVSFDSNGGSSIASQSVISGNNALEPTAPTKNGSTFLYWSLNGNRFNFSSTINSSITLTAVWGQTVTFDSNGGSSVSSQTVVSGQTATEPTAPTKTDYTFGGWTLNNSAFSFSTPITGDITLVASWTAVTPVSYTVTFDSNGGSAVSSQTVVSGQTATEPTAPTKSDYTFAGWTLNNAAFSFSTPISGDITLVASWTAVTPVSYTVTFDSNGGSSVAAQTVVSGQTATEPTAPTKTDYTFAGWTFNNAVFSFSTPITSSITLLAEWSENAPDPQDPTIDPINPLDPMPDPEDDPDDPDPTYFTVTYYDYDERSTISPTPGQRGIFNTEQVLVGGLPENYNNYPSSAYFIFQHWAYIDSGEEFDPSSPIYEDVFLIPIGTNAGSMD